MQPLRSRPQSGRFIHITELQAGDRVRNDGQDVTVAKVERSTDGYHWRVSFLGRRSYDVFPPVARFTATR